MATLYEVLDEFCRNKKSGKIMPKKNWPKPNTQIHRSVNHDPDETSPEIMQVSYCGKVIVTTYQDGRIVLNKPAWVNTQVVRDRINELLNKSDTGWTVGGYYGPWYMCYMGQKIQKFEDGITIEPAPQKDWSKAKAGDTAVCFYCHKDIYVPGPKETYGGDRVYWFVSKDQEESSDPSFCPKGWAFKHGKWHSPEWRENDNGTVDPLSTLWKEAPDGNYSLGDVSTCTYCHMEITLNKAANHHIWQTMPYQEGWCNRAPTSFHPAGESTWHHPNGEII